MMNTLHLIESAGEKFQEKTTWTWGSFSLPLLVSNAVVPKLTAMATSTVGCIFLANRMSLPPLSFIFPPN